MRTNHLEFLPHQQRLDGEIYREVLRARAAAEFDGFSAADVAQTLAKVAPNIAAQISANSNLPAQNPAQNPATNATPTPAPSPSNSNSRLTPRDLQILLSPAAAPFLEQLAQCAKSLKEQFFGTNIYFFTPLYIDNHCDNNCIYCGFNKHNRIRRKRLDEREIAAELDNIARAGFSEVLLLTGEMDSREYVGYIARACELARERFANVGVEVYPLNVDEYERLHAAGADFVTIFQETYDPARYERLHIEGNKRIFPYRFEGQERAVMGGMRGVGFAALLGLDDWRRDALSTALHASLVQRRYPHAEISLSVPRLRPTGTGRRVRVGVSERELVQVIAAYRIYLPFANITLSSRESARFRDHAMRLGVTKVSAGVSVGIGTHGGASEEGDGQFEIADGRSLEEMRRVILNANLTPVANDTVFV